MTTRNDCLALDAQDALAPLRQQFALPEGVIYLDGNSLGARPVAALARAQEVIAEEWGNGLIRSWNSAGWRSGVAIIPTSSSLSLYIFISLKCTWNILSLNSYIGFI